MFFFVLSLIRFVRFIVCLYKILYHPELFKNGTSSFKKIRSMRLLYLFVVPKSILGSLLLLPAASLTFFQALEAGLQKTTTNIIFRVTHECNRVPLEMFSSSIFEDNDSFLVALETY